ncbi:hypothetical protein SASPL_112231 [Salvia splendens]|uniref:Agmatinase n=1 Tax=Salvia splendens TaxID=180675 RepID=A0A8X8YE18_SALSN|nr:hypothetical protein SASPL_112231 [Salvia splendens]
MKYNPVVEKMKSVARKGIHYLHKLNAEHIPKHVLEKGQARVIEASLTLIRERAKLKGELLQSLGGVMASATLLGTQLFLSPGHCLCTSIYKRSHLATFQCRTCVDDDRLMNIISDSVKIVMEEEPLRPVVLGGDHSISYPVVRAVSEKLVLHLDAHPDIYDAFEGNKYSHASKLGEGVKEVYISIDVDCLDPAFVPGVSHFEPGGLSFRDVLNVLHNLKGDIVAADVVEYNPQRDTAMVAAKLVRELTARISK